MARSSSQKFIARNRAPRVQIEYDVETYGSEKKVQLPFVVGVMSDLSGKPVEALPPVADRKMLEIDVDNFDNRMKSMKPRVAFMVPNTLTGEGKTALRRWAAQPSTPPASKDDLLVRVYALDSIDIAPLCADLMARREYHRDRLARYERVLKKRFAHGATSLAETGKLLTLRLYSA